MVKIVSRFRRVSGTFQVGLTLKSGIPKFWNRMSWSWPAWTTTGYMPAGKSGMSAL